MATATGMEMAATVSRKKAKPNPRVKPNPRARRPAPGSGNSKSVLSTKNLIEYSGAALDWWRDHFIRQCHDRSRGQVLPGDDYGAKRLCSRSMVHPHCGRYP